ncbi:Mitochondrial Carrier (MC) Family [Thraustotheca clavata]|uniref:Mitochondrial Carrier (MC) Family n=1 Tax=Thraustotheca clavata TaxID=74557 RepID=A0A1W0AAQ2_9STRA|nr:Mitochondrial Carrier (MC) Family [Thraustotheca clavata]
MATNKAFAEATAGSVGALFACLALFPLDVAKTKHQASVNDEVEKDKPAKKQDTLTICKKIWDTEGIAGLFSGLGPKAIHTVLSNFCYFYWYAWLKTFYEKKVGALSTASNLFIGALAGAINMTMTLPWDVISTYIQTSDDPTQSQWTVLHQLYKQDGIFALWKGYIPSLVLVSNPAINYTIFDRLKLQLQTSQQIKNLSAMQAFVVACIAKSIATVMTYPIIRSKVIMQANSNDKRDASMTDILKLIWHQDGLHGFFKGCEAQLFNTVLKSALLLMTKEQITFVTMKLLSTMSRKATK